MSQPELGTVTVVIATYNMARYLPEAVQSVLAQTIPGAVVQIVDDGSTDNTAEVVTTLTRDPRVRAHRQANGGQARAKNKGIALSASEFVAFLDADDTWHPDKLERQLPLFMGRPGIGVVFSDYECMDAQGKPLFKGPVEMFRGQVAGQLLINNFIGFPTAVVRRSCLEHLGGFDESIDMGIDYDLWLRLAAHYEFDFVAEPTARYRIWAGQMSKNYRKRYTSAMNIMRAFLAANPQAVTAADAAQAWAQIFIGRGNNILWQERDRIAAYNDYLQALRHKPVYWPVWRAMLRGLITVQAPR